MDFLPGCFSGFAGFCNSHRILGLGFELGRIFGHHDVQFFLFAFGDIAVESEEIRKNIGTAQQEGIGGKDNPEISFSKMIQHIDYPYWDPGGFEQRSSLERKTL